MKKGIHACRQCHNLTEAEVCSICADPARSEALVCVVEDIRDLLALESTGQYRGKYHVLGGVISPMDGIGPNDLNIDTLVQRLEQHDSQHRPAHRGHFALPATMEGETTAFYLFRKLANSEVEVTAIARGLAVVRPAHADEATLVQSLKQRLPYTSKFKPWTFRSSLSITTLNTFFPSAALGAGGCCGAGTSGLCSGGVCGRQQFRGRFVRDGSRQFPEVHLIDSNENLGFSKGNNLAIRQSKGRWVLLLNPDTIIQEDTLLKCLKYADARPRLGGLGVPMVDGAGRYLPESKRGIPTPNGLLEDFGAVPLPSFCWLNRYYMGNLSKDESQPSRF